MHTPLDILAPLSADRQAALCDPTRDPAAQMPVYATAGMPAAIQPIPSVETIEAALNAHVREGEDHNPKDLIQSLLHPFADEAHICLEPGKGKTRPSYAISIIDPNVRFERASTHTIAKALHATATALAGFAVGRRAPKGAPVFKLNSRWSGQTFAASDPQTLRRAYRALTGRFPAGVRIALPLPHTQLIDHVRAACALVTAATWGQSQERQRAEEVIAAATSLRTAATIGLRQVGHKRSYARHALVLSPSARTCTLEVHGESVESNHDRLAFQARYKALTEMLVAVMDAHPVLASLPPSVEVHLDGEIHYLHTELIYTARGHASPYRRISSLSQDRIGDLITALADEEDGDSTPCCSWEIYIEGRVRCESSWDLYGPTLAQALAKHVLRKKNTALTKLTDLLIDLVAGEKGIPPTVHIDRIL